MASPFGPTASAFRSFLDLDEFKRAIGKLQNSVELLLNRVELLEILLAPKTSDRMFTKPFQMKTVGPRLEAEVYRQDVPKGYIGVITRMGNDWFPDTVLTRAIDNSLGMEPQIERSIAPTTDPVEAKVFVRREVVWRAKNNDAVAHTFGILTDGFFIPFGDAEKIINLEL